VFILFGCAWISIDYYSFDVFSFLLIIDYFLFCTPQLLEDVLVHQGQIKAYSKNSGKIYFLTNFSIFYKGNLMTTVLNVSFFNFLPNVLLIPDVSCFLFPVCRLLDSCNKRRAARQRVSGRTSAS